MRQGGYNLVMLMVAITVLNILVAISLPMWSQLIRRDQEEELISRGWQYVEAIRVFQNRFQRLPIRLEELAEVKPRCIRRLWKDPMTDEKFQPIFQNEGAAVQPQVPGQPDPAEQPPGKKPIDPKNPKNPKNPKDDSKNPKDPKSPKDPGDTDGDTGAPGILGGSDGQKPNQAATGPIVGVRSRSNKKSILVFFGKERYDEWRFTIDQMLQVKPAPGQIPQPGGTPGTGAGPGSGLNLSTRWLGRPLYGADLPQATLPGGGGGSNPPSGPLPPGGKGPGGGGKKPRGGSQL